MLREQFGATVDLPARRYPGNQLARNHEGKIAAGNILPEVAAVRGYLTATEDITLAHFHFTRVQRRLPGLLIPIYPVVGNAARGQDGVVVSEFATYRPDDPRPQPARKNGKPVRFRKYEQAAGVRNCLDCLPSRRERLADPAIALVITEGVLKGDAIESAAIRESVACVVISVHGTFSWRGKNAFGGLEAVADWERVPLNGRRVAIVFDSDAWRNPNVHAALRRLKAFLEARGAIVEVVYLPDLSGGVKCGADDYLGSGHTLREMMALAEPALRPLPAPTVVSTDSAADVTAAAAPAVGPVRALAVLLEAVLTFYKRFVAFANSAQEVVMALWTLHTHAIDAADVTPYLFVNSPEPGSGKTRLEEVGEMVVYAPWPVLDPTDAVVFRTLDEGVTMLLDEADAVFGDKKQRAALSAILNAGYRRGRKVARMVGEGAGLHKVEFAVFGPKMIAGLGNPLLPSTRQRCIPIELRKRNKETEKIDRITKFEIVRASIAPLRDELSRWAAQSRAALDAITPDDIEEIDDRTNEVWLPLRAIAELAGGSWPRRALDAMIEIHGDMDAQRDSLGIATLRACRAIFAPGDDQKPDDEKTRHPKVTLHREHGWCIPTVDLLDALCECDDGPWDRFWGEAIQKAQAAGKTPRGPSMSLAGILKPYKIAPAKIRLPDSDKTANGYRTRDFNDAWARYLGPCSACSSSGITVQVGTLEQTHILLGSESDLKVGTRPLCSDLQIDSKPLRDTESSDVPTLDPIPAREEVAEPTEGVETDGPGSPERLVSKASLGPRFTFLGEQTKYPALDTGQGQRISRGRGAWQKYYHAGTTTAQDIEAIIAAAERLRMDR